MTQQGTKLPGDDDLIPVEILMETNANEVFQALEQVEGLSDRSSDRWLWELVQNAVDARPLDGRVSISLSHSETSVNFEHNGRPFSKEDVAHLIFHGSTKFGKDLIGQYGTGFLTTHVLSRRVQVRGILNTGAAFSFTLDRNAASPSELLEKMKATWSEFLSNQTKGTGVSEAESRATFHYELGEAGKRAFSRGVEGLSAILPYVLAFNDAIEAFTITLPAGDPAQESRTWQRGESLPIPGSEGCSLLAVSGGSVNRDIVAVGVSEGLQAAVLLTEKHGDGRLVVSASDGSPSLYAAFPLRASSWMRVPCVINSRSFRTTDDRQGIVLGRVEGTINEQNKDLLTSGFETSLRLIRALPKERCDRLDRLGRVATPDGDPPQWLEDRDWLVANLANFIDALREVPLVETHSGYLPSKRAKIWVGTGESVAPGAELLEQFFPGQGPAGDVSSIGWAENLEGWTRIRGSDGNAFEESYGFPRLGESIAALESLSRLAEAMGRSEPEAVAWIDAFVKLTGGNQEWVSRILPSQSGKFTAAEVLRVDDGVATELKEAGDLVGLATTSSLLHSGITPPEWLSRQTNELLVPEILQRVLNLATTGNVDRHAFARATGMMFRWAISTQQWSLFENRIPFVSRNEKKFGYLSHDSPTLIPVKQWDSPAGDFAKLFPLEYTMSSLYNDVLSKDDFMKLCERGLAFAGPFFVVSAKLDPDEMTSMVIDSLPGSAQGHSSQEEVNVSDIALLTLPKDHSVIDAVRTPEHAGWLLKFILISAPKLDPLWSATTEVVCVCGGTHRIHAGRWLRGVRKRSWIPAVREGKPVSDPPSTENIRQLVSETGIEAELLLSDSGLEVIRRLGIQPLAFLSRTPEEEQNLIELAHGIQADPDFLETVNALLGQRRSITANQRVGNLVQDLVNALLTELLKDRAKVVPNYSRPGFDEYIEGRLDPESDAGQVEISGYFLEIKTTRKDYVGMTPTQAEFAKQKGDHYALCVVSLPPTADVDILSMSDLAPLITIVPNIAGELVEVFERVGDLPERTGDTTRVWLENLDKLRFAVSRKVWNAHGLPLGGFLGAIFGPVSAQELS